MAGTWDPTTDQGLPGLYINFRESATAQIGMGERGTVAMPLHTYTGTAAPKTVYTIESERQAIDLFGDANIGPIRLARSAGARLLKVYTMPKATEEAPLTNADYVDMRDTFDTIAFNVFVYDKEMTSTEQDACLVWLQENRKEGKQFEVVFGGSATEDQTLATGIARSIRLADQYVVNLITGGVIGTVSYSSGMYAAYIAGLIAATPINRSITYAKVSLDSVNKNLTRSEQKDALAAGCLVLIDDGAKIKVLRGVQTDKSKIRKMRARQAVITDMDAAVADYYIGKVDNNVDGQKALISAVKVYLETLAAANVFDPDSIEVGLDPNFESKGDQVYLYIRVVEIDSMEEIYITIEAA